MSKRDEDSVENSEHNSLMNYNSQAYGHDFVQENVKRYIKQFERGKEKSEREAKRKERIRNVADISNNFYTLVTDFYEYGYGRSFHFAPVLSASSSLQECVVAYEREIARTIKANQGMKLLVGKLSFSLHFHFVIVLVYVRHQEMLNEALFCLDILKLVSKYIVTWIS